MDALNSSNEKQQADAKYAVLIRGNTDGSAEILVGQITLRIPGTNSSFNMVWSSWGWGEEGGTQKLEGLGISVTIK